MSAANYNAAGQVAISGGTNPALEESKTNTTITRDPFQNFLFQLLGQQAQNQQAYVPDYTKAALENFTSNPAAAANYFPQLAQPLIQALRPAQLQEQADLQNLFRSAGGTQDTPMQSGAFAQSARQLLGDQANRTQQVIAEQYVPLTNQISTNMTNAIRAGLEFPQANTNVLRTLAPLAGSISPISTQVEGVKGSSNATAGSSGYATAAPTSSGVGFLNTPYSNPSDPYGYIPLTIAASKGAYNGYGYLGQNVNGNNYNG